MRIAFVSTLKGSPWGGSEELWCGACDRALKRGHQTIVSRYEWDVVPEKLAALGRAGATLQFRPRRPGKIARLFPRPKWLREIESFDPDVLCLSQGGAYETAGHRSARPLIKWLARCRTSLVNVIQFNTADTSLGSAAAVHARWLYGRATVNAFVAQENADEASRRLAMPIPRVRVVVNPVNLTDTTPLAWPAAQAVRFAAVARLDARTKGQDVLLEVLAGPAWKSRDWTLDFFGEGPDDARYRRFVREHGLESRVRFMGHTSDVRAIWTDHHALLLPSRAEGTPLAMQEAMILGRPCLVCDVGGCAGWVTDGVEGVIAPECTSELVGAAMERLWNAREHWPAMGLAARERAVRQLGPDPAGALLDLLESAGASPVAAAR